MNQVVILGAGLAGLALAHRILEDYAVKFNLQVFLVSPNDEFYWNLASVRAIIPGQYNNDQIFFSIPQAFSRYPTDRFEFVLGTAKASTGDGGGWDPKGNSIAIALNDGSERTLTYNTIIVATGSHDRKWMPWKNLQTSQATRAALDKLREDVKAAKSIVVGGAGATGVEVAGELGYEYARNGLKKVTLVYTHSLPLGPDIMEGTRRAAKSELEKLGVHIITEATVAQTNANSDGHPELEVSLKDGTKTKISADLFLPTFGTVYNSDFAPADMRSTNGRLPVNEHLQASGHKNVFIVGDVADLEPALSAPMDNQVRYLAKSFDQYFAGRPMPVYKPVPRMMMAVTTGRERGTGQLGWFKFPSIVVWYVKGRHLGTDYVAKYVAGERTVTGAW